ncbi:MAG: glycoside hydrolase [Acutalibacteraceae bacterium]|nr:glycoside hydrolase [Acutalibacteraceae bacterium]
MFTKIIAILLAIFQFCTLPVTGLFGRHQIVIDKTKKYQTFEEFGTSSCWWAQTIDDDEMAREIAKKLYSEEEGLGLKIFRYNVGGGEADNPDCRIWDTSRRTESFYVLDEETGEYVYDFTRDANARRVMDYAVEYGAEKIILFCNSPHFSMTKSGHASGGLQEYSSNLPEENYQAFVDYLLTIADWFVAEGYPIYAISPINEPQWSWGSPDWVGQEGCHYEPDEAIKLLEMFATEMQKRNSPYKLSGPENGQMNWGYYAYVEKFFESEILNEFCDTYSGHSYWMDSPDALEEKTAVGKKFKEEYPDKKYEMSEWCELPLQIDSTTIDSGLRMAKVIVDDLNLMNAVSWQSWTAVNGDGLLDRDADGKLIEYNRYYAFKQFTSFIKPGMTRVRIFDILKDKTNMRTVAFIGEKNETVIVIVNPDGEEKLKIGGILGEAEIYLTDATHNCEKIYEGEFEKNIVVPEKSIMTICVK